MFLTQKCKAVATCTKRKWIVVFPWSRHVTRKVCLVFQNLLENCPYKVQS